MSHTVLIDISCPDRTGLVSAIAGALFDMGANLGDATFAVLGELAEFTGICTLPNDTSPEEVEQAIRYLPEAEGATISIRPFSLSTLHGPAATITHRITVSGGDRPGLVARLAEVFVQYHANIVRLNSERVPNGSTMRYIVRFAVNIPQERTASCLATVANTAGELGLSCAWEES